jgi:hypothetical protein
MTGSPTESSSRSGSVVSGRDRILLDALARRFAPRWDICEVDGEFRMTRRGPAPSALRRHPPPLELVAGLRDALERAGLITGQPLLPVRWRRDTDLTVSAVQALDPWLKDARPLVWREGFLPQPVVRSTGVGRGLDPLPEGLLSSFVNISYVQRIPAVANHADLLDRWIGALSAVGLHACRLTIHGRLEVWHRPPVSGITLFIDCDDRELGDAVLLWNTDRPHHLGSDLGSGLERLSWLLGGGPWARAAFGDLAGLHDLTLLDASRTATLLLMSGVRPQPRGAGGTLRAAARRIDPAVAVSGLSRLVRAHHRHWAGLGVQGPSWPVVTSALEDEVLAGDRRVVQYGAR